MDKNMDEQAPTTPEYGLRMRFTVWWSSTYLGSRIYQKLVPAIDRWLMRRSKGTMSFSPKGDPEGIGGLAMLSTIGAKSGKVRDTPLGFVWDGDSVVMAASNSAQTFHPAWYWNLKKNPDVTITTSAGHQGRYVAREVEDGPERDRLWAILCAMNPGFERYPARTGGRLIPVIHCTPVKDQA